MLHEDNITLHGIRYFVYNNAVRSYILIHVCYSWLNGLPKLPIFLGNPWVPRRWRRLKSTVSSRFSDPKWCWAPPKEKEIKAHALATWQTSEYDPNNKTDTGLPTLDKTSKDVFTEVMLSFSYIHVYLQL